ncbi:SHOCT domain-containing protein [Caproiciproducens sp.]
MENENKTPLQSLLIILIVISVISFIACLGIRQSTEQDYVIAQGNALTASYTQGRELSDQSDDTKALDVKRNACVAGMIASGIVFVICAFTYPATKRKKEEAKPTIIESTSTTTDKLQDLNNMLKNNLISQDEYDDKRKKILDSI